MNTDYELYMSLITYNLNVINNRIIFQYINKDNFIIMFINFIKNIITYTIIQNKEHMLKLIVNDFTNIISDYINISQEEKHKNTHYIPKFIDSYIFGFKKINEKYFYNCNTNFNIDSDIYSSIYYNTTNINQHYNNMSSSSNISCSISSIRNMYKSMDTVIPDSSSSTRTSVSSTNYNNDEPNLHISNDDININYYRKIDMEHTICNSSIVSSLPNNMHDMNVNNNTLDNYGKLNNYDSLNTDINSIKYNIKKTYTKKRQHYKKKRASIKSNLYNSQHTIVPSNEKVNVDVSINSISITNAEFTDIINKFESELQDDNLEYNESVTSDYSINEMFTKNRTTNLKRNKYKYIIKHKLMLLDVLCHIYKYNIIYYIKYKHNTPNITKYHEPNILQPILITNIINKSDILPDYTDIINNINTITISSNFKNCNTYDIIFTDILSLNNILLMQYIDIINSKLLNLDTGICVCTLIKNKITSVYNTYMQSSYNFDIVNDNIYDILIKNLIIINVINLILIECHNVLTNNIAYDYKYLVLRIHNYIDDAIKQSTLNTQPTLYTDNEVKLLDYKFIHKNGNYNLNINEAKLKSDIKYITSKYVSII